MLYVKIIKMSNSKSSRRLAAAVFVFALMSAISPARAQDVQGDIARAQRTLQDIERLIDGIQSRAGSPDEKTAEAGAWKSLFDGKSLGGWERTDFGGGGEVRAEQSFRGGPPAIVVEMG